MAPIDGDNHVSQTLAFRSCRGIVGYSGVGADLCLRLGRWLVWRLSSLVGSARLFRGAGLLRLWRLLRPPAGADPLGTPLAAGQSLLLRRIPCPNRRSPGQAGASCWSGPSLIFMQILLKRHARKDSPETIPAWPSLKKAAIE